VVKHEAAFQRAFGRWLQYEYKGPGAVFELKRTLTNSLPLKEIRAHQVRALSMADTGLYYKIPDDSMAQKPFDCFFLKGTPGFVVIAYGPQLRGFFIVPVEYICELLDNGTVSITSGMAHVHGSYHAIPKKSPRLARALTGGLDLAGDG